MKKFKPLISFSLCCAVLFMHQAEAAIIYTDIPDIVATTTGTSINPAYQIDINGDMVNDFGIEFDSPYPHEGYLRRLTVGNSSVGSHEPTYWAVVNVIGQEIGPSTTWLDNNSNSDLVGNLYGNNNGWFGWYGGVDGYFAVRLEASPGNYYYGWVRVQLTSTQFTLKDFAFENTLNEPITAGEMPCPPTGTIWYVDGSLPGSGNGSSWVCAFKTLHEAVTAATAGHEIWVKAGTHYTTTGTDRTIAFTMKNGVAIYGGFTGTETMLNERDWVLNTTILSGEIGAPGNADNSYHVILNNANGLTAMAVLDGFTITGANANGTGVFDQGGGMYNIGVSPKVVNCTFTANTTAKVGGAILNLNGAHATIENCTFNSNSATGDGGAIYNFNSAATLTNCSFTGNTSGQDGGALINVSNGTGAITNCSFTSNTAVRDGGAIYNFVSTQNITNCSFTGNSAMRDGGGVFNVSGSSPVMTNCIFSGNAAGRDGGGLYSVSTASPQGINCTFSGNKAVQNGGGIFGNFSFTPSNFTNCIIWGNSTQVHLIGPITVNFTNSIVQGGCPALAACTNVQNTDPLFVEQPDFNIAPTTTGNLQLQVCSPAIEIGADAPNMTTTDLAGNPRKVDAITGASQIDLGAYEFQGDLDLDNDGSPYCNGTDCDDMNPANYPGNTEICGDGMDNNCNGIVDDGCPVDCVVGEWTKWSECSAPCGGGMRCRTRKILVPAQNGGIPCPVLQECEPCNTQPCCADADNDGYLDATCGGDDCDDNNPNINPSTSPEQTSVTYHNPNSVTVYWSNIAGSTNYAIRHRELGSNGAWTEATSLRAWRRLFSLAACTDYEVQFKNYKNSVWNCWSESDYFTTSGCAKSFNPAGTKDESGDWQVFPNPVTNTLNIVLNENMLDKSVRLTLRDQLGRTVWSKNIQNLETTLVELNVREYNLAASVYTLSLQNDESTTALQVVVNR